jgi:vacuolar-type H+-ATPase subunit F/Vma7
VSEATRVSKMGQDNDNDHVAIIADKYLAYGFRMAGVIAFPVRDAEEAARAFEKIVAEDKFDVIIITENLSIALKKQREAILAREKERPVIAVIPDFKGPTGERLRELRNLVTQSVGAELKFEG